MARYIDADELWQDVYDKGVGAAPSPIRGLMVGIRQWILLWI